MPLSPRLLVVDSSVVVKWLTTENEQYTEEADNILKDLEKNKIKLFLPELVKYEIGNALIRKKIKLDDIKSALKEFYKFPVNFVQETIETAKKTLELVFKYEMTYYDASFISLAQTLKADLVTDNIKHQGRYKDKEIKIIALKDYR